MDTEKMSENKITYNNYAPKNTNTSNSSVGLLVST